MYHNYHKHDHYGNPWTIDVIVKPEEYCKRAVELGHNSVFTVNHGVTGNIFEWLKVSKEYNLKLCYGTEAYYVQDRFEKDRSNRHIIIIAKNDDGIMQLNDIMSEAHMTGFYYKPRIDSDLLFSLDHNNFIITTACIKGIWNDTELVLALKRKFGKNFFLELQCHNAGFQKDLNTQLLSLSKQEHIPIIHANDSHYIYPEDSKYRDIFLKGKGMDYQDENEMILDYPSEEEIYQRYEKQGILTRDQVTEALNNTMVFDECEKITLINDDIKLPSISNTPMEDLKQIVRERWKEERKQISKSEWKKYTDAIIYELDIIEKTKMANYFLIDYNIVKNAQEKYGGRLTKTGRGSAPSFYVTKMLGLTDIDRVSAPITLFPTRFMSTERILGSRSLPDIDLNTADRVPFIKATEDLLGKENCAWMLAWKPLQNSSAFRLYCKGIGLSIKEYDEIAKNLELYENDPKWKNIIKESKRFIGVIESISESPCSMLLYNKPVRKEIGLVRTNNDVYCCLLDGINCDSYKYLKNDYLSVTIWAIIRDVCELANISIPTIREINSLLDNKTFDIYEKGLTCTINQADSEYATPLVKRYNPKSVSEMSAFVAIIRPGCASLLQDFIDRKPYTTGIEELDEILVEGNHRMIYQELIMKYLIWLGIPETGSYDIIKKIAKKKFKEPELIELKSKLLNGWINRVGKKEGFEETWAVVQDAAKYSFNACVSGNTIIQKAGAKGHYNPSIKEMYFIMHDKEYAKKYGHLSLHQKFRRCGYGNALSMYSDNRVHKNIIKDIYYSGTMPIYRVTTESGSYIDCTMNHKFPTPSGNRKLEDLKVGDELYTVGDYEKNRGKYSFTDGSFKSNIPKRGEKGFQKNPNGNSVLFMTKKRECEDTKKCCEICSKPYDPEGRFELHHADFDRTNNNQNNLKWLCCSCHKRIHYQNGRKKMFDKGLPINISKIISIVYLRTDDVYDIEMSDPAHNFISESGLITSNSHSLSYAYDSLYGAYLKSHYPLEYYTVALNYYRGDTTRTSKLKDELEYWGIKLVPIKFRKSQSQYSLSKEENYIYQGISSIKNCNETIAGELYALRDNSYDTFVDLLYDIKEKTSVNSKQLRILIELDFFTEFGESNHLLNIYKYFESLGKISQLKKEKIAELGISPDIIKKYATKETEKMFIGIDVKSLLICLSEKKVRIQTLKEKIAAQIEYLGYINIVDERYKGILAVLEINTTYSPKLKVYSLKNGTVLDMKIDKRTYNSCKLETGDIIKISGFTKKPKVKRNEDGKFEPIAGTSEMWITKYTKLEDI